MGSGDGKIRKNDLVKSDAIKVYDELEQRATKALKGIAKALNDLAEAEKKVGATEIELEKIHSRRNTKLTEAEKLTKQLKVAKEKLALINSDEYKQLIKTRKALSDKNAELRKGEKATKNQEKALSDKNAELRKGEKATKNQEKASKGLTATFKNLLRSMVAFIGVRMFIQVIKDTFQLTKKLDSLNFAMLAIAKTQKMVAKNQAFLARITKAYGADIVSTTERYIRFLAAAKQSNVALKDTQNIFETFTKVSGVLGMNTQDLTGIFLALEQMLSKGKVTTEELRRQLGERLPGAMGIMATSLGVTIPQLDVMLKKGEVLSAEVLPEFARQVELSFGINNVKKVETLAASWTRFKNKFIEIFSEFAKGSSLAKKLSKVIDLLAENFADILKVLILSIKVFVAYKVVMSVLSIKTALLALNTKLLAKAEAIATAQKAALTASTWSLSASMTALNTVMKANILGIVIGAVVLAIAAFEHFSISLEDTVRNSNKASKAFIESADKAEQVSDSIDKMSSSYNRLSFKVGNNIKYLGLLTKAIKENEDAQYELNTQIKNGGDDSGELTEQLRLLHNEHIDLIETTTKMKDEQLELDRVTRALATAFPDAVTAQNDYGDASKINTGIAKELNDELKEQLLLKASVNQTDLKENLIDLEKDLIIKERSLTQMENLLSDKAKVRDNDKIDNIRQLIIETKMQIKANDELIFSFSEAGIAKRESEEAQAKLDAKKLADAKKEEESIKNLTNLGIANNKLLAERTLLERSDRKIKEENGKISTKTHTVRIDEINKEIKANQKLMDAITGKKNGGSKAKRTKVEKIDTSEIDIRILQSKRFIEIENKISKNKERTLEDRTNAEIRSFNEQNVLLMLNYDKQVKLAGDNNNKIALLDQQFTFDNQRLYEKHSDNIIKIREEEVKELIGKESGKLLDAENERNELLLEARTRLKNDSVALKKEEQRINLEIDKKIATAKILSAELALEAIKKLDKDNEFEEEIKRLNALIKKLRAELAGLDAEDSTEKLKMSFEEILDLASQFNDAIGGLFDAISDRRLENIDAEINAETEKYDRLLELAEGDKAQQESVQREKDAALKKLDKKRLKEEQKAAKQRKIFALADIAIQTALSIQRAKASSLLLPPLISDGWFLAQAIMIGALSSLQTAAVLASPIPQYAEGLDNARTDHTALINDGGRREFIERNGVILSTPIQNAVVDLKRGDTVHKDMDSLMNASIITSLVNDNKNLDANKLRVIFDANYNGLENAITNSLSRAKFNNNIKLNGFDTNQEAYRQSQSRWN